MCAAPPPVRPGARKAELGRAVERVVPRIGEGMMASASMPRFRLVELTGGDPLVEFAGDVAAGLTAEPRHLSCRYFFYRAGSRLFSALSHVPQYYLTCADAQIP